MSQVDPQIPPGNSNPVSKGLKKVYAFGILPADCQGMGFQRHWVLVLPDPLEAVPEESTNADGELLWAMCWEVRVYCSQLEEEVFRM